MQITVPSRLNLHQSLAIFQLAATTRGFTGRHSANQGLGLTMSTKMVLATGGRIGVFSGRERLKQRGDDVIVGPIEKWQGTAVYLEFDRQKVADLNRAKIARSMPKYQEVPDLQFG